MYKHTININFATKSRLAVLGYFFLCFLFVMLCTMEAPKLDGSNCCTTHKLSIFLAKQTATVRNAKLTHGDRRAMEAYRNWE